MKRLTLAFSIVPLMLLSLHAQEWLSGEGWKFFNERGGVHVYTRINPENNRYEAKATYTFDKDGERYLNRLKTYWTDTLFDKGIPATYPKGYQTIEAGPTARIVYMTPNLPFYLKEREIVMKQNFSPMAVGQGMVCYANAAPDRLPPTGRRAIRVEVFDAVWIARVEDDKLLLALRFHIDPAGNAPEFVTRPFVEKGAERYLLRLVDILTHDAWFTGLE